jgi:hypothetical protein
MEPLKLLSLWEPWATFMALDLKPIETRPWGTKYRGLVALQAAKTHAGLVDGQTFARWQVRRHGGAWAVHGPAGEQHWLTFGAIVAVGRLRDVLPIIDMDERTDHRAHIQPCRHAPGRILAAWPDVGAHSIGRVPGEHFEWRTEWWDDQEPFGNYETPGRYGWLFEDIRRLGAVPCRGFQGLRDCPAEEAELVREQLAALA